MGLDCLLGDILSDCWEGRKKGDGWTVCPPQDGGQRKHGDLQLLAPGKPCFHTKYDFMLWLVKTASTQVLSLSTPLLLPAAAYVYCRRKRRTLYTMADPGRRLPPWSVDEVLG